MGPHLRWMAILCVLVFGTVLLAVPASRSFAAATPGGDPRRALWNHPPRRVLWIEVSANLPLLSTREGLRALVERARRAGIDTLVPEAKNAWGYVIYESQFAPHIRTSPVGRAGYPPPRTWYPTDHDALRVLIEEAHAAGLRVHVAVNVYGEGLRLGGTPPFGMAVDRPDWAAVPWDATDREPAGGDVFPDDRESPIIFADPSHPEVALYELAILWEIATGYEIDGLVLDRARYGGLSVDFSERSRSQFEAHLRAPLSRWPVDVLVRLPAWVAWRGGMIRNFVAAADRLLDGVRPGMPLAMYVGGWYPEAYRVGQNWASSATRPLFAAWSPAWGETSLLAHLDYLMVGLYYPRITGWQALLAGTPHWRSVEGNARLARQLVPIPLLGGVWLDLYARDRPAGAAAMRTAAAWTDGLMLFDLSDVDAGAWWELVPP